MDSELREYSLIFNMRSGAVIKTDLTEVKTEAEIANVAAAVNKFVAGDEGVFLYLVDENLTYIPYRNVEFVALEYVVSNPDMDMAADADSSYIFSDEY